MRAILAAVALASVAFLAAISSALADQQSSADQDATLPRVTALPRQLAIASVLPHGVPDGAFAIMHCTISTAGVATHCEVSLEHPEGAGIGAAALRLADNYRFIPATRHGTPIEGETTFPVGFGKPLRIRNPDWVTMPTEAQIAAAYPPQALARRVGGVARVECSVSVAGGLYDCDVIAEDPPGMEFGAAALILTQQFFLTPRTINGVPIPGGRVRIPINFLPPSETGSRLPGVRDRPVGLTPTSASAPVAMVTRVAWDAAPTYAQVASAYPAKARAEKAGGHVGLDCAIVGDGRLSGCRTTFEAPQGYGFARAAKSLARDFRAPLKDFEGSSLRGAAARFAVTFTPDMLSGAAPAIGNPQWIQLPAALDAAQSFPAAAAAAHVAVGHVVLDCAIVAGGALDDCKVSRDDPPGLGFGAAALALAPKFRLSVWTDEGLPTIGGRVNVPIRYDAPAPPVSAPPG